MYVYEVYYVWVRINSSPIKKNATNIQCINSAPYVLYHIWNVPSYINEMHTDVHESQGIPTCGFLHFHHMWFDCKAAPRLLSTWVCHRLQAVNISVQWSCVQRQPTSWVRLTGLLRAIAQESLQYLIAFFFFSFLLFYCTLE